MTPERVDRSAGASSRGRLLAVSAAVLAVAGIIVAAWATGGDGARSADAGGGAAAASTSTAPQADPSAQIEPSPGGPAVATPVGGMPWDEAAGQRCAAEVGAGGTQVAQVARDGAVTSFWTTDSGWALCDTAGGDGTTKPVVIAPGAGLADGLDAKSLALGVEVVRDADGRTVQVRYVAGGRLPWPVRSIGYTFPDGHTEKAVFVASADGSGDTWWTVSRTVTEGPLLDPAAAQADPVTVSVVGGAAQAARVPWADLVCNAAVSGC